MKTWQTHAIQLYSVALLDLSTTWAALHAAGPNIQAVEANPVMAHLGFWGSATMKLAVFGVAVACLPRMSPLLEKVVAIFGIGATSLIVLSNSLQLGVFVSPVYAAIAVPLLVWALFWPLVGQRTAQSNQTAHKNAEN